MAPFLLFYQPEWHKSPEVWGFLLFLLTLSGASAIIFYVRLRPSPAASQMNDDLPGSGRCA